MKKFTCFTCVCFALFFGQKARAQDGDGVLNEIKNLKANMNAVLANQTAAKAQIDGLKQDVAELKSMLAALKTQAPAEVAKSVWRPAQIGAWGQTVSPGAWVSTDAASVSMPADSATSSAWGISMMTSSSGSCANGSCSTGRGRGFFRR